MRSAVAEEMRAKVRERMLRLTPSERAELALILGDEAVASYAANHGITADEARDLLRDASERERRRTRARRTEG